MFNNFRSRMGERFADVWVLLSDTDRFVSRSGLMPRYERQLREWRSALQESGNNLERNREIREDIVAFRKARRTEGFELRLGSLDVQVKGYRSDDALSSGFRRIVLMVGEGGDVRFMTGSANHLQLDDDLNARLSDVPPSEPLEPHYLWYRRIEGVLEFAGADSEPKDMMQAFIEYVEKHKSDLVRALYKLN